MFKSAILLGIFAILPALISFALVPAIGVLDIEDISPWTYIYLDAFYAPIMIVMFVFVALDRSAVSYSITMGSRLSLYLIFALSLIFLIVSIYDLIASHSIFTLGISGAWKAATDAGPRNSVAGAIILLLAGGPTFFFCTALVNDGSWGSKRDLLLVSGLMFATSLVCMMLLSSRNSVFISLVFICAVLTLKYFQQLRQFSKKFPLARTIAILIAAAVFFIILIGFSLWIFIDRATVTHGGIDPALDVFLTTYKAHSTVEVPSSGSGKKIFYALAQLEFYITHSIGYFSDYFSNNYCPADGGAHTFYAVFRIIDFVFGADFIQTAAIRSLQPGVYLSLPGFLYLDFCMAGILVGWFLGLATTLSVYAVFRGYPAYIFVASFCLCMFAFAPFYSLPATGNGFSLMLFAIGACITGICRARNEPRVN